MFSDPAGESGGVENRQTYSSGHRLHLSQNLKDRLPTDIGVTHPSHWLTYTSTSSMLKNKLCCYGNLWDAAPGTSGVGAMRNAQLRLQLTSQNTL